MTKHLFIQPKDVGGDLSDYDQNRVLRALMRALGIKKDKAKEWWIKNQGYVFQAHNDCMNKIGSDIRTGLRKAGLGEELFGERPNGPVYAWVERNVKEILPKIGSRANVEVSSTFTSFGFA